jgi:hypothetical protein
MMMYTRLLTATLPLVLALAGLLIAVGIVVARAVAGTYTGLGTSLVSFVLGLLVVAVFYPVRQFVVQSLILGAPIHWRGTLLDSEIARDKNVAAGLLEAVAYLTAALFVNYLL